VHGRRGPALWRSRLAARAACLRPETVGTGRFTVDSRVVAVWSEKTDPFGRRPARIRASRLLNFLLGSPAKPSVRPELNDVMARRTAMETPERRSALVRPLCVSRPIGFFGLPPLCRTSLSVSCWSLGPGSCRTFACSLPGEGDQRSGRSAKIYRADGGPRRQLSKTLRRGSLPALSREGNISTPGNHKSQQVSLYPTPGRGAATGTFGKAPARGVGRAARCKRVLHYFSFRMRTSTSLVSLSRSTSVEVAVSPKWYG
jgi:hypothetical protein